MRIVILLLAVTGLLAIRAMAPPQLQRWPPPNGEYSLKASQIWQVSGENDVEFDIAADGQGRRPVLTSMADHGIQVFVNGEWKNFIHSQDLGRVKPGFLLPNGHYRLRSNGGGWIYASGYWASQNANSDNGYDVFLPQSRLWGINLATNSPEFTIPNTGTYMVRGLTGQIDRWNGSQWEPVMGDGSVPAPGIRLETGLYRLVVVDDIYPWPPFAVGYVLRS